MQSKMISSWIHLFLLGSLCSGVFLAPLDSSQDPELTDGYFEGDIILDEAPRINGLMARSGLIKAERLWPNAIVPYNISEEFEPPFVAYIEKAMRLIEQCSCVRFVPAVNETAYLSVIVSSDGCSAQLGYANSSRIIKLIPIEVESGCFKIATIQHELLHILGFAHQHSSPDRDTYVKIVTKNIKVGKESAFAKKSAVNFSNYGVKYDYGSVMHYRSTAFSSNGLPTIKALNAAGQDLMGQRVKMSDGDIKRLNNMYKCTTLTKNKAKRG